MKSLRPGGFTITDKAMEFWKLHEGASVLDIGCGKGDTVKYLTNKYNFSMTGIDTNLDFVNQAKTNCPNSEISYGDGEFLDGFSSFSFDGLIMECVLSLINLPDEALHESYCVLKKDGKLFISDLYIKDPPAELLKAAAMEAERMKKLSHADGACNDDCSEEHKVRAVDFRISHRFLKDPLINQLKEIGYKNIVWNDFSSELSSFVAEAIMNNESLDDCFCGKEIKKDDLKNTGYFLLVAEK